MELTTALIETQKVTLCNFLWCIWKARNKEYFSAKKTTPAAIIAQVKQMEAPVRPQEKRREGSNQIITTISADREVILIDASWDVANRTGTVMLHYDRHRNRGEAKCDIETAQDPFHAEVGAILQALRYIQNILQQGNQMADLLTSRNLEGLPSWRATEPIVDCLRHVDRLQNFVHISHIKKEALHQPHLLANWARKKKKGIPVLPGT